MYFEGTQKQAKTHFNRQVSECGFKGAKFVSVSLMSPSVYDIPRVIITPDKLVPKKKPRKRTSKPTTKKQPARKPTTK
jgi:hypothetical protein